MRILVLASGSGTLLQALIDGVGAARASGDASVEIAAVGADRPCQALERAAAAGIESFCVDYVPKQTDRAQWNQQLADTIAEYKPDLVVSAGFMRIIGESVIERFPGRIINTHPALLPAFPGAHGVADALDYGVRMTGSTVHVVDTGVDTGPIIAQQPVAVAEDDTVDTLHERIKQVERKLLVEVIYQIAENGLTIDGRKARVSK